METFGAQHLQTYGKKAAHFVDEGRRPAAGFLDRAADFIASKFSGRPACRSTVRGLHDAAGYVRGHDMDSMRHDAMSAVRRNPGYTVLAAAAVGFVLGRSLFRR
jgi:hypothetical protein